MKEEEDDNEETQPMNESPANQEEPPQVIPKEKKYKISIAEKYKEIMKTIKDKTGINGLNAILFLILCVLLVYFGIFEALITNLVGTIYPGYYTIKAIEQKQHKKEWLTYWVIFGTFIIFDMFSNIIMKIVPFYFVLKILFLIWMFSPESKGRKLVYNFLIYKLFKLIEESVDYFFNESKYIVKEFYNEGKEASVLRIQKIGKGIKVFKDTYINAREKSDMEEARKTAQELEKEENKKNKLKGKKGLQTNFNKNVFESSLQTFPKNIEKKYFNEELKEISKNEIPEKYEEHKDEEGNIVLSDEEVKEKGEKKEEKKEDIKEEKKEDIKEEKKVEEKIQEKVEEKIEEKVQEKVEEKIEEKVQEIVLEKKEDDDDSLDENFEKAFKDINEEKAIEKQNEEKNNEIPKIEEKNSEKIDEVKENINEQIEKSNNDEQKEKLVSQFDDQLKNLESLLTSKKEEKPEEKKEEEKKEEEKKEEEKKEEEKKEEEKNEEIKNEEKKEEEIKNEEKNEEKKEEEKKEEKKEEEKKEEKGELSENKESENNSNTVVNEK